MIPTQAPGHSGIGAYGDPPTFRKAKKPRKVRPNKAVKRAWPGPHAGSLKVWARRQGFNAWIERKRGR